MAGAAASQKLIRCPVCLTLLAVSAEFKPEQTISCNKCKAPFALASGLDSNLNAGDKAVKAEAVTAGNVATPLDDYYRIPAEKRIPALLLFLGLSVAFLSIPGTLMDGPQFLFFYAAIWFVTIIAATVTRKLWGDHGVIMWSGFFLFEGVGVVRWAHGISQGMHKFAFLGLMMVFGGLAFMARAKMFENTGNSGGTWFSSSCSSGSSCSGGSSCGGGGCGGGGCGGCGS